MVEAPTATGPRPSDKDKGGGEVLRESLCAGEHCIIIFSECCQKLSSSTGLYHKIRHSHNITGPCQSKMAIDAMYVLVLY